MKIARINIESCNQCPHCDKEDLVCLHKIKGFPNNQHPMISGNNGFIPDWCPLPNVRNKNTGVKE